MKMKLSQRLAIKFYTTRINTTALVSPVKAAERAFKLFCTPLTKSRQKQPDIFHKAEGLRVLISDVQIYGWIWKPTVEKSKKVLIAHGFNSCSYKFEKYVSLLLKNGFEVIAFDAPAHGKSKGKQINALMYKEMILHINKVYGNLYGIISHSFGGLSAALAAEELPDLKKLVLIAPASETNTAINNYFKLMKLKDEIRPEFEKILYAVGKHPLSYFSVSRALPNIFAKTLWLHDTEDLICPFADAEKVIKLKPEHVEFKVTTGLGHNKIYKDNSIAKEIVKFVSSV
jgi:pimeloyl-ACP methyl ester carboxylesterase